MIMKNAEEGGAKPFKEKGTIIAGLTT